MPPPTIGRIARKPVLWDAATTGLPTRGHIGIFNILKEYTSRSVEHIGTSTTVLNEQRETLSVGGFLNSASINSSSEAVSPCYSPTSTKRIWRSPERYREDSSCEEDKEQNIVNLNSDYDESFESDSSLLELIEDICFSCDSDASSSVSPSSSPRNTLDTSTPVYDKNIITEKKIKESSRANRDTVKQVKTKPKPARLNTKKGSEKTERRLKENPSSQVCSETARIDLKRNSASSDRKIVTDRGKNSGDIRLHISRNDTISLQGKDVPSLEKRECRNIGLMVKEKAEENATKQNRKSTKGEIKSNKMLCVMQRSQNSSVCEKRKCSETVGKEKLKRKSKSSKLYVNSEVKQQRDPEKVNSLKTVIKQQKKTIKAASKQTNKNGQELNPSDGKENHQEKSESLVASDVKSTNMVNPPNQSAKLELNEDRSRSNAKILKCDKGKSKGAKPKNNEHHENQKPDNITQKNSSKSNSVKTGDSSKQSNENIKLLNPTVNVTSLEFVQTIDSEKVKKKLKRSSAKERVKRDIAREKDKQKKHSRMRAEELHHKNEKRLESVKTGNSPKQAAAVKNVGEKYHHKKNSKP